MSDIPYAKNPVNSDGGMMPSRLPTENFERLETVFLKIIFA